MRGLTLPAGRAALLAGAVLLAAGCDDPVAPSVALWLNQEKWEQQGPSDYQFEFQRLCFCLPEATIPVRITVDQGNVAAVVRIPGGEPVDSADVARFFDITVDSLFGVVGHAIAVRADHLTVEYHPVYGYPTDITIDYDVQTADEEVALDARLLTPQARSGSPQTPRP